MVSALYRGTIQFQVERDLNLTRLSALISPYLANFMKHNKSNTTFLHEIVIIFSSIYFSDATYLIQSNDRVMRVNSGCNNYSMNL